MNLNTVPNWLTLGRIFSLPLIIILASFPDRGYGIAAAIVFSIAAITDFLDGYIARRTGQVSEFGKLVDPIADEGPLVYLEWVQNNLNYVNEQSNGRVGYLHIPDMGSGGIYEFIKWFYPQIRKQGLIVDVRGNGGGNVS